MKIKTVGDKIQTKKYNHIHNNKIRSFITVKIQVNDEMVYIKDKKTISGIKEFKSRKKAREVAHSIKDSLKKRAFEIKGEIKNE